MDRQGAPNMPVLSSAALKPNIAFHQLTLVLLAYGLHMSLGLRIINCNNSKVEIFEVSPAPVTCGYITSTADVDWLRGDGVHIGECKADGTCTTALYNDYSLRRSPQSTESQLTLVPDYRRHAGLTVTCQDRVSVSTASCTLVIKHHSELSGCQVTINTVDWTVSGSCRVQQAFSSDNIYTCTWTRNTGETFGGFEASRELCSFTQALPQAGGLYTYSISVSPPATTTFSQQLRLVEPGDVTTSCPHSVVSGRDLSCTCQTTNTASPPATVRWEGRDSEKLVKTNVQREDNGTQFTCHVTWAGRVYTSINYTLLVEYVEGPSDVVVSETHHPGRNNLSIVTLSCSTTGAVYPGVTFTWSPGVCQNETHTVRSSTCTVSLNDGDDLKNVTCTAINSIDSLISVSTSVTLQINAAGEVSDVSTATVSLSSTPAVIGPIIGAVIAVVVTAVIAILLAIFIRRRRRRLKTLEETAQYLRESDEVITEQRLYAHCTPAADNHGYEDLHVRHSSEEGATTQLSAANMYDNTQTLADKTYDSPCTRYEEHQYADLKVKATRGVKVTNTGLRSRREGPE